VYSMQVFTRKNLPENALTRTEHAKLRFGAFFSFGEGRSSRLSSLAESHKAWAEHYKERAQTSGQRAKESQEDCQSEADADRTEHFRADEKKLSAKAASHFKAAGKAFSRLGDTYFEEGKFGQAMESFHHSVNALASASVGYGYEKAMKIYSFAMLSKDEGKPQIAIMELRDAHTKLLDAGHIERAFGVSEEGLGLMEKNPLLAQREFCEEIAAAALTQFEYGVAARAYSLAAGMTADSEASLAYRDLAEKCKRIHDTLGEPGAKAAEALLANQDRIG